MESEKEKIIAKIQKILIQAKDQEDTPEGKTFKRHAAMLMAKYRIKETEIDLKTDNFILDTFIVYKDRKIQPQWGGRLVSIFADTFDCKVILRKWGDKIEYELVGTFSDVETSLYFIEVVFNHIEKACFEEFPQKTYSKKRNQLGNVAAQTIWERAWELKSQMDAAIHEDKNCTDLVVMKKEEIEDAVNELYPNLKSSKGKKTDLPDDRKTWDKGEKIGKSAPLNFAITEENAA